MIDPKSATYEADVKTKIAEEFTPEEGPLPRMKAIKTPAFGHHESIEDHVKAFRSSVERFFTYSNKLIENKLIFARFEDPEELAFDYEGAVKLFDHLYEARNLGLLAGHTNKKTDEAFGKLFSSGYFLGRALLAESVLRRDKAHFHAEIREEIAQHMLYHYMDIGLQKSIMLRKNFPEAMDFLEKTGAQEKFDAQREERNRNHFALITAAQSAYEQALPKKLESHILKRQLSYYADGNIGVFLPFHKILTQNLLAEAQVLKEKIGDAKLAELPEEQKNILLQNIESMVQTERDVITESGFYKEEIIEPYLSAARNALHLQLIAEVDKEPADLRDRIMYNYLYASARYKGLIDPVLGHTLDLQLRLAPRIPEHFALENTELPEVIQHTLWVYDLKDEQALNKAKPDYTPIIDLGPN